MFLRHKKSVSYILKLCRWDVIILLIMTIIVSKADDYLPNDQAFPLTIPSLLGTALSLVLAFRTSQAYDRWWEARKIWGAIVNDSRSVVRATETYLKVGTEEVNKALIHRIGLRQIAWTYALGKNLRGQDPLNGIEEFLSAEEFEKLKGMNNVPNALLHNHSKDIRKAREQELISEFGQLRLDELVMRLVDSMGGCERIKGTIFPTPYNRIVHITIYIFAITLTIGISDFIGFRETIVTVVLTTIFLALERVAVVLQDPWEGLPSDIPVTMLSHKIETDLKQMMGDDSLPEPLPSDEYFVM